MLEIRRAEIVGVVALTVALEELVSAAVLAEVVASAAQAGDIVAVASAAEAAGSAEVERQEVGNDNARWEISPSLLPSSAGRG